MLDDKCGEKVNENGFTNSINFKMSTIGHLELLGKGFPMRGRKKFGIYDGGGSSCVEECNDRKGF